MTTHSTALSELSKLDTRVRTLQRVVDQIEPEIRQLHGCTSGWLLNDQGARVPADQCRTCRDSHGWPELYPCPTLRLARRMVRLVKSK